MDDLRILHLRFGIILTDHKQCRFVVVRVDTENYPLVFLRECSDDPEDEYDAYFTLYKDGLTADEADEILDFLKAGNKRKANIRLKQSFKPEGILCELVGEVRLDDAIPDDWYDVWKEIEGHITSRSNYPGYYEADVEKREFEW